MEKSNHIEEIRNTRVGGFGGSDAAMLVAIAERIAGGQPLTTTQKHRVRVAKGLETPPPPFSTPEIDAGRAFENEVAAELKGWGRETYLSQRPNTFTPPMNFTVFAHADFYQFHENGHGFVKECKWSRKFDHKGLQKEYRWQLQWYYMLGADSVSLVTDTADGREVGDIKRKDKDVETLRNAVAVLDAAWHELDLAITEFRPDELPPEILRRYAEVAETAEEVKKLNDELEERKAELMKWMEDHATAIEGEKCKITYTPAGHTVGIDAKKFEADHADLYAAYCTKVTQKKAYLTVKINK